MTKAHLDELWERIEELSEQLLDDPDNRGLAMVLDCAVRNYDAKVRLFNKDSNSLAGLN